jgi:hypothetical protein
MSIEQRQQELLRRRENHKQSKQKGKQVETTTNNVASRVPFQNLTNTNFSSTRFQGVHDFDAGPSLDILMIPHLVSHGKKLYSCLQFYIVMSSILYSYYTLF